MAGQTHEPHVVLVRHGDTEWSRSGQHTSRTDLPLLPEGRERAIMLREILDPDAYGRVLCSPMRRAVETCELAGFGDLAEIVDDLREWDYGEYEGLTSDQIHALDPGWSLWHDGCPGGETPDEICERADRVIELAVEGGRERGPTIMFAHGHVLRVLSARWIGLRAVGGERLVLEPARVAKLAHEHTTRVVFHWNVNAL
jgi:probable phosphoglycerate mutase